MSEKEQSKNKSNMFDLIKHKDGAGIYWDGKDRQRSSYFTFQCGNIRMPVEMIRRELEHGPEFRGEPQHGTRRLESARILISMRKHVYTWAVQRGMHGEYSFIKYLLNISTNNNVVSNMIFKF